MSQLETGILTALLAAAPLTAIVGTRIRPIAMGAADVRPYVVYHVTADKSEPDLDGTIDEYRRAEFELGIYGDSFDDVTAAAEAARDKLDQLGGIVGNIEFAPITYEDQTDAEEVVPEGAELPIYLRVQTYKALYRIVG